MELLENTVCRYARNSGKLPDLLNPQRFSDYLILYKCFGRIPFPSPEDKLENEIYIPEDAGGLVAKHFRPFISSCSNVPANEDIAPGTYVWKTNHGWNLHQKVTFPVDDETRNEMEWNASVWLSSDGNSKDGIWWNDFIQKKVYLEKHLGDGEEVDDWKFFVFGGRVEIVQVDKNRFAGHLQNIYDRDFSSLPDELFYGRGAETEKPKVFDEMVSVAEAIGRSFEFIRVDLYCVNDVIYLGEIGIAPGAASGAIISDDLDLRLGSAWPRGGVLREGA